MPLKLDRSVMRRSAAALAAATGLGLLVATATLHAQSVTRCGAANPYDELPDEGPLQACLDNFDRVLLEAEGKPGYVGYVIADTLMWLRDGALLTSASSPAKAVVVAAPSLAEPLLHARADRFELSFIRFDGAQDRRDVRLKPCNEVRNYRNVELRGTGFNVRYVESTRAVCGSGMTIGGSSNFTVVNSWFYDNGRQPEDADGRPGLWADGLNVFNCAGATIRDNEFWDNTDVDLGVNGGPGCSVYRNTIQHFGKYAFAGLVVGDPTRAGGEFSYNRVESAKDMVGFGMVVGCHPWPDCGNGYATRLAVHHNDLSGAVVNLVVDGLNGGYVEHNTMRGAQGTRALNCATAADYTISHVIDVARLQSGYIVRSTDPGQSCDAPLAHPALRK
jgi:Right handed beta helix region